MFLSAHARERERTALEDGHWARFLGFHMKTKKQEGPGRIFDHRCSYLLRAREGRTRKDCGPSCVFSSRPCARVVEETGGRYSAAVLHFFFYYFGRWYLLTVSSISFLFPRSLTTAQFLIPSSLCCRLMPVRE